MGKRLFFDIDGTLAVFQPVRTLETLYEKGYFYNLKPIWNVLEAVKIIVKEHPEIKVGILSSVLSDSRYALEEKEAWLDKYLPEVQERYYPRCGEDKKSAIPGGVTDKDYLFDDYTKNLMSWEPPAKGIKVLNGINHTNESWKGNRVSAFRNPRILADCILAVMEGETIKDLKPVPAKVRSSVKHMDMEL